MDETAARLQLGNSHGGGLSMLGVIFQFVTMVLVGALLFAVKKGFSEVIRGLESLDERLERTDRP